MSPAAQNTPASPLIVCACGAHALLGACEYETGHQLAVRWTLSDSRQKQGRSKMGKFGKFPLVFLAFAGIFSTYLWTRSYDLKPLWASNRSFVYVLAALTGTNTEPNYDESALLGGAERVIVTLTRTSKESKGRLKNMLASIQKYYTNKYKIVVFCDMDYNNTHQAEIKSCTDLDVMFYKIDMFEYMEKNVTLEQAKKWIAGQDGGIKGRKLGYRLLCRFWAVGVYRHPLFRHVKFLMRMDDDSHFTSPIKDDPFAVMEREKLDYGYRAWFGDGSLIHGLWNLTKAFAAKKSIPLAKVNVHGILNSKGEYNGKAVYNNFFVVRMQAWQAPLIQSFLNYLVSNHGFLKLKHGDANVHAMAISLGINENKTKQFGFGYNHNIHMMQEGKMGGYGVAVDYWFWLTKMKCRQIARANPDGKITYIKL